MSKGRTHSNSDKNIKLHNKFQWALTMHRQGQLDNAAIAYKEIILEKPNYLEVLHMFGLLRYQQGSNNDAMRYLNAALKIAPANASILTDSGVVLSKIGQHWNAVVNYNKSLTLRPNHIATLYNLGDALLELKRPEEALANYDRALALKPDYVEALVNRGNALRDLKRFEDALRSYEGALALRPNYVEVFVNRGNTLRDLKRPEEALASYDLALALRVEYPDALVNRGNALIDLKRSKEALESYGRALVLKPAYPQALLNQGNALKDLKRPEAALNSYDKALSLKPDYAEAYDNKGVTLMELGRFDEAASAIETAITLAPKTARFYYNLTSSKRLSRGDWHIPAMEQLALDKASLSDDEQIDLHFALGKAYADIGEHERSFAQLSSGNALKRKRTIYDEVTAIAFLERMRESFTSDIMSGARYMGDPSPVPVFILGMPRSGTTLVEQILSSHPKFFGAGEIDDFDVAIGELGLIDGEIFNSPDILSRLSNEQLNRLGATYLARIKDAAPLAERISNKTPENFRFAGLIHLALPNAHIIHVYRNPIDTCLSCFSKRFVDNLPYTYDLAELGRYYRAYEKLMAHWRGVMPRNAMLEVQYEEVVADLEGQARRIVAYCGLEWDARCLDFHRTKRPVRTASATQVRQPIYKSSVDRWRAYESFLGPLLAELKLPS